MRKIFERIRNFGLYINGRRVVGNGFRVLTNPFSGRVIGRVFLTPQESFIYDDNSPTSDEITPTDELTPIKW